MKVGLTVTALGFEPMVTDLRYHTASALTTELQSPGMEVWLVFTLPLELISQQCHYRHPNVVEYTLTNFNMSPTNFKPMLI